jgi:hypothetical protein
METIILFRKDRDTEDEFELVKEYFDVVESRMNIQDKFVIARYSALPFYDELEKDLEFQGSKLINSYNQHKYIADFEYYYDIEELTPKTYFHLQDVPTNPKHGYVVKGKTNSRKFYWKDLMFADSKIKAITIACNLNRDPLIAQQGVIVRDFIPLRKLEEGVNGLPFSNEWRFFCYKDQILSYGYYWSTAEEIPSNDSIDPKAIELVKEVCNRVSDKVNFFVVDVAEKEDNGWIVIEMNDGQMSGLSQTDPSILYKNLNNILFDEFYVAKLIL